MYTHKSKHDHQFNYYFIMHRTAVGKKKFQLASQREKVWNASMNTRKHTCYAALKFSQ